MIASARALALLLLCASFALASCESMPSSRAPAASAATGTRAMFSGPRRSGPIPDLSALMGAGPEKLSSLLGEPTLRRKDIGAALWQYAAPACTLLLFLYPDAGGNYAVTHIAASPSANSDAALKSCVQAAATRPMPATS